MADAAGYAAAWQPVATALEELREQNEELGKLQIELERQKRRYQDLFSLAPDGCLLTDRYGAIREANHEACALLGTTAEWLKGKPLSLYLPVADQRRVSALIAELTKESEQATIDLRLRLKEKLGRDVEVRVNRVTWDGESGEPQFFWALRDVTARNAAQEALERNEALLRLLAENANDMISRHDEEGTFLYASAAAKRLVGYRSEELERMRIVDLAREEDASAIRELLSTLAEGKKRHDTLTYRIWCKNGSPCHVESTFRSILHVDSSNQSSFIAVTRDVSERVQAEERLRRSEQRFSAAFHRAPMAACLLDQQGTFVDVNDTFSELTGYPAAEVVGRKEKDIAIWSLPENVAGRAAFAAAEHRNNELWIRNKEGGNRVILSSAVEIEREQSPLVLHMFYDITERKKSEEQLMDAIQEVMQDTSWFAQTVMGKLLETRGEEPPESHVKLTKRERQVLQRIAKGYSNVQIARELGIADQTVRNYVATIYDKVGVHSRAQAVVWARERGLVTQ